MKIVHFSDVHIRNFKYHKEYEKTFENFFGILKDIKPDYIFNLGDTFHAKTQISPEAYWLARNLLSGLSKIAPQYIILGNHDCIQKNRNRLTPIDVISNQIDNLVFLKQTGNYELEKGVNLHVYSILDRQINKTLFDDNDINIGLYHGIISRCNVHENYKLTSKVVVDMFDNCDYLMLGDIHNGQKVEGFDNFIYAGSLIQQNFGEQVGKGFLVWDIRSKQDFDVEFVELPSPQKFYTFHFDSSFDIERYKVSKDEYKNARIRALFSSDISILNQNKVLESIKNLYDPIEIKVAKQQDDSFNGLIAFDNDLLTAENIRSLSIQDDLIRDYVRRNVHGISDSLVEKVIKENREIESEIVLDYSELKRNVNIKFKKFEFDNLFGYGKNNILDFEELNGIVGIFGNNSSGKSSFVQSILLNIFNKVSNGVTRNVEFINRNEESASSKLCIEVNGRMYVIERNINRKDTCKNLSETSLDFYFVSDDGKKHSLTKSTRSDTEKEIRKLFGTFDDAIVTFFSPQGKIEEFIENKSTSRKRILSKFLDLDIFNDKYKIAKNELYNLSKNIKKFNRAKTENDILKLKNNLKHIEKLSGSKAKEIDAETKSLSELNSKINLIVKQMGKFKDIDIDHVRRKFAKLSYEIEKIEQKINSLKNTLSKKESLFEEVDKDQFDKLLSRLNEIKEVENNVLRLKDKKTYNDNLMSSLVIDVEKMQKVPCGDESIKCPLFVEVEQQSKKFFDLEKENKDIENDIKIALEQVNDKDQIMSEYDNLVAIDKRNSDIKEESLNLKNRISEYMIDLSCKRNETSSLEAIVKELSEAKNIDLLKKERSKIVRKINRKNKSIKSLSSEKQSFDQQYGFVVSTIGEKKNLINEHKGIEEKIAIYEILTKVFGRQGLGYEIITNSIPMINKEIENILSGCVDFDICLKQSEDSDRIDIILKYEDSNEIPIELGGGMQKMIASLAIRTALINISNLPKSNVIFIDEGFGVLDASHLDSISMIFEKMREYFDTIFIITHIQEMQDIVDHSIAIDLDQNKNSRMSL